MVYLDYSATTPVNSEVLDTFIKATNLFIGNPNSMHKLGVEAKKMIDGATKQISNILGVKEQEIIYTSGATESNNTAIKGICYKYKNRGNHIITTELEHSSVTNTIKYLENDGFKVDYVKLDENGIVDLNNLKGLITDKTILVSICSMNSEIGLTQPIEEIGKILKQYPKIYFHSDITQSIGKEKLNLENVDLASSSAQKFFGLKGIGILIKKEKIIIDPLIHGGKSTTEYRSGTPSLPLILSYAKALRLIYENFDNKYLKVVKLNKYLLEKISKLNIYINNNDKCSPYIINISLKNIKPETMLHSLAEEEIYISTKTACTSSNISQPLFALTKNKEISEKSLRISLSHLTTFEELDYFCKVLEQKINNLNI